MDEHYENTKKQKYNNMYMDIALRVAQMSHCQRRKVGALLVRTGRIISMGWNGTRAGENNICEDLDGITLQGVAHAEENCLKKLIISNDTSENSTMYVTTLPCVRCAEKIVDAKITTVYYAEIYRNTDGLEYLKTRGIEVHEVKIKE